MSITFLSDLLVTRFSLYPPKGFRRTEMRALADKMLGNPYIDFCPLKRWKENIMGKIENAGYQQLLSLFHIVFNLRIRLNSRLFGKG